MPGLLPYTGSITSDTSVNEMAVHLRANDYVDTMNCKSIIETVLQCQISKSQELKDLIDFFDFNSSLKKKYKQLSGGQKQRFTLILVLMQNAPLTFFDEVTTGLDFETRMSLMDKLSTWYQDKGAAIVFVTHYFEELSRLTNKLLIIDKGHFIDYGDRDELFKKYCGHLCNYF
ncbi:ATP-binding cassette domain-containing protein [Erysipelothrix sp. D19-032]